MSRKYCHIVFLQGEEAEEAIKTYEIHGLKAAAEYLSQWDYGEDGNDLYGIYDTPRAGDSDSVERVRIPFSGLYLLTVNLGLGYIGLEKIIEE